MDPKSFYGLSTKFISKIPKAGKTVTPKRGHPNNGLQQKIDAKKKRGPAAEMPQAEYGRMDSIIIQFGETHVEDANYLIAKRNLL